MYIETKRVVCVEEPFVSVYFDHNLNSLVTCTYSKDAKNRSGQLRILNKETLSDERKLELTSAAFHLEYVNDFYVAGLGDGRIVLFDPKTLQIQTDEPQPFAEQMITDAKVSSSNRVAITDESGALRVYERANSTVIFDLPKAHEVYGQSVNAWSCEFLNSNIIVSGGDDDQMKFWDLRVGGNKPTQISRSHSGGVVRIRKFGDNQLFTGSYDETFRCFDVRKFDEPLEHIKLDGGVWDFQVQEDRILIANMYGGWSIVDRQLRLNHHQPMTNSLVYGLTSARDEPECVYCCSFTDGVLCAMKRNLIE
ncbi:hypothetical protein M3Y98_00179400 [Aphelenchoides besseyi]|nr:hypothetical protein M3Y98_00179400 [Aphelenchoides besseyi]KAI6200091.1 hypothetical protein M3Y96_00696400 [Aphelenchoides besseyi]